MTNLRLQKRLAASVLGCGKRRVWLDPNEAQEIGVANSRQNIRKLIKDGLVIRKPTVSCPSYSKAADGRLEITFGC
jgi:large subunit ribosomal protein L19e